MKPETIKVIFTNILFVIGVVLLVIGFTWGLNTVGRLIIFDKYPVREFEETRCNNGLAVRPAPVAKELETSEANLTDEEKEEVKQNCLTNLEHTREVKKFDDLVGSAGFLISGAVITYSFRKFILK